MADIEKNKEKGAEEKEIPENGEENKETTDSAVDSVELKQVTTRISTDFIEANQQTVTVIAVILVIIVGGYFGFKKFYLEPTNKEAFEQMFMAEKYFEKDSLDLALNGDGNYLGFLDIIDDYSLTDAANLANYYTGIIYLKKGEFQNAIDYLDDFASDDILVMAMAYGAKGDAYLELGDVDSGLEYYLKAANEKSNNFSSPIFLFKAAIAYEEKGNYKEAVNMYKKIQKEYPDSKEAKEIEKYITKAENSIR